MDDAELLDKKGVTSSLSADAAEFVPLSTAPKPQVPKNTTHGVPRGPRPQWRGGKPVEITEVPRYLTSCYPFVSADGVIRQEVPGFQQPFAFPGMPQPMPVTAQPPPPVRLPNWQTIRPGFVGNYPPSPYGSVPFDTPVSVPVDVSKVGGDGLLPTPSAIRMTLPGQEVILTPQPEAMGRWVIGSAPRSVFIQQNVRRQQPQQFPQAPVTVTTATACPSVQGGGVEDGKAKPPCSSNSNTESTYLARPESPVLISRSSQTELPSSVLNYSLQQRPHPFYIAQIKNKQLKTSTPNSSEGSSWKTEDQDSDSGYNSPKHRPNLVSIGTQVKTPGSAVKETKTDAKGFRLTESDREKNHSRKSNISNAVQNLKEDGELSYTRPNSGSEVIASEGKKKKRKKKDQRDPTRSPRLGSNSKLLSRSSSSISSSGTKPDEDDEKIDLHSWTDFPPVSSKVIPPGAAAKPTSKSSTSSQVDERMSLTIERSAFEPPWQIKFSTTNESKIDRSRSNSGEKNKIPITSVPSAAVNSVPESAWGKIGRSFKNSQNSGLEESLSILMSNSDTVPLLSPGGKSDSSSIGRYSGKGSPTGPTSGKPSSRTMENNCPAEAQTNRNLQGGVSVVSTRSSSHSVSPSKTISSVVSMSATTNTTTTNATTSSTRSNTYSVPLSKSPRGGSAWGNNNVTKGQNSGRNVKSGPKAQLPSASQNSPANTKQWGSTHHQEPSRIANAVSSTSGHALASVTDKTLRHNSPQSPLLVSSSQQHTNPTAISKQEFNVAPTAAKLSINYHIPQQIETSQLLHNSAYPSPPFRSYANITQGAFPKAPAQCLPPQGQTQPGQASTPFHGNNPSFNTPPPAFIPRPNFHYPDGSVGHQASPPLPNAGVPVPFIPSLPHELSSQPPPQLQHSNIQRSKSTSTTGSQSGNTVSSTHRQTGVTSVQQPCKANQTRQPVAEETQMDVKCDAEGEETKRRRRRRRRRNKSKREGGGREEGDVSDGSQVLERAVSSSNVSESTLHFEDIDEFPDLLTSSSRGLGEDGGAERSTLSGTSVTYSDIIKATWSKTGSQSRTQSLTGSVVSGDNDEDDNTSCHTGTTNESKRARKRRKRREQANKAAEAELAEISLEQQWLKEVGLKKSANQSGVSGALSGKASAGIISDSTVVAEAKRQTAGGGGGKKSQQPIAFDIAAMIDAIQKKPAPQMTTSSGSYAKQNSGKTPKKDKERITSSANSGLPGNMLDSSAPVQKRGKEREMGKAKKPSPLKKVILKEREQRKRLRLLDEDPDSGTGLGTVGSSSGVGMIGGESELSQDALSSKSEGTDGGEINGAAELSTDLSPISQTSPISMSPASPGNSGVNSPITGSIGRDPVVMKIHSRRFREYCTQILDKEIDQCCTSLLQDLVKFQDRMYHKDPVKAKTKRRVVLGLREVTKHLKLKKIKCVVISPNLEKIQSKGGLDEALNNILNMCGEQDVPFVFALGRRALGRACAKLVPVSVVGIFNYEGCESKYHSLISLTAAARSAYHEMVLAVEKEVAEYPTMASQTSSIGGVPGLFAAHMGHSRTPSGCSAISFTSSILSEPISENFPHAEPEVDSKGYEIVRDAAGNVVHRPGGNAKKGGGTANDIDDGNEADIEDFGETRKKKKGGRGINSVRFGDVGVEGDDGKVITNVKDRVCNYNDEDLGIGKLSRNVSASTLTNEDNLLRTGEPYSLKCQNRLDEFENDEENDFSGADSKKGSRQSATERVNDSKIGIKDLSTWEQVKHIDSIHSFRYNLGEEILSHHTSLPPNDPKTQGPNSTGLSQLSPSSLSTVCRSEVYQAGKKGSSHAEEEEAEEPEAEKEEPEQTKRRHMVIDKERIENWLESQSNLATGD